MALFHIRNQLGIVCCVLAWSFICLNTNGNNATDESQEENAYWKENWNKHQQNLTRVYDDGDVAVYKDSETESINREDFDVISQNWKSITSIYNSTSTNFGNDSKLHVIFHNNKYNGVHIALHSEKSHGYRNVIDCGQNDPEKEGDTRKCTIAVITVEMARLMTRLVTRPSVFPANLVSDWKLEDIILLTILVDTDIPVARIYSYSKIKEFAHFPQKGVKLYSNWYANVYNYYGRQAVVRNFTRIMTSYASTDPSLLSRSISPGEFVHFWSQAAGHDLRIVAYKAFGWTQDYQKQFLLAQTKYSSLSYMDTFSNASIFAPSLFWKEDWDSHSSNLVLTRIHDYVAFYVDIQTAERQRDTAWLENTISVAWKYLKETYGPFGPDPYLYIIFHAENPIECIASKKGNTYVNEDFEGRAVLDCKIIAVDNSREDTAERKQKKLDVILQMLSATTLHMAKETGNWPAYQVSGWRMVDILVYDLYLKLGRPEDAKRWATKQSNVKSSHTWGKGFLFRDWFSPIYDQFNGSDALSAFVTKTSKLWPKNGTDYIEEFNVGEFIHLWNMAVNADLHDLVANTFTWTKKHRQQLREAQARFPNFTYTVTFNDSYLKPPQFWNENWFDHSEDLVLAGIYQEVAVYVDTQVAKRNTTWLSDPLSDAWKYVKEKYGPFGPDPYLYVVFHPEDSISCISSKRQNTFVNEDFEGRAVLDCKMLNHDPSREDTEQGKQNKLDVLLLTLSVTTLYIAKGTGNWPAYEVTERRMADILVYDLYLKLGRRKDAEIWAKKRLEIQGNTWKGIPLFRNWFYPIYIQFNGSETLHRFISTTHLFWPKNGTDYIKNFNVGEFVHFWSTAVNFDLQNLASLTLKGFGDLQLQLQEAQKTFPNFTYSKALSGQTLPFPNQLTETWLNHTEQVVKIYQDENVLIFADANFNTSTITPLKTIAKFWRVAREKYRSFKPCFVVLHGGKSPGCRVVNVPSHLGPLFRTFLILDCQLHQANSNSDPYGAQDLLLNGLLRIILLPQNFQRDDTDLQIQLSELHLPDILLYDLYTASKNDPDALRWKQLSQAKLSNPCTPFRFLQTHNNNTNTSEHEMLDASSPGNINLFRDWYLPIYSRPGGTKVLEKFVDLLQAYKHRETSGVTNSDVISVGEFVHFWSGVVKINLEYLANSTFETCPNYYASLIRARAQYPQIQYSNYTEDIRNAEENNSNEQLSRDNNEVITISVTAVLLGIAFVVIMLYWHRRKIRTLQAQIRQLTKNEIRGFFEGTGGQGQTTGTGNASIEAEPFNQDLEISRDQIEIMPDKILGSGEYGLVLQGTLKLPSQSENTPECVVVAIKTPKPDVDVTTFKALLTELKVMGHLGAHENVIKLHGAVTAN